MCKLLGIDWDNLRDEFAFDFSELLHLVSKLPKTKMLLLKLTASLFDPLGLLSPLVITLKLMFQDLCTSRVNWDEPLPDLLKGRLETSMKDLERITELIGPNVLHSHRFVSLLCLVFMGSVMHQNVRTQPFYTLVPLIVMVAQK